MPSSGEEALAHGEPTLAAVKLAPGAVVDQGDAADVVEVDAAGIKRLLPLPGAAPNDGEIEPARVGSKAASSSKSSGPEGRRLLVESKTLLALAFARAERWVLCG